MALDGSSSGEFDIMSPADEYVNLLISETPDLSDFRKMTNHLFAVGSCSLEKKTVTMLMYGDWVDAYNIVQATITLTPKEHITGSCLAWIVNFEKKRHETGPPERVEKDLISHLKTLDRYNYLDLKSGLNGKDDYIDKECPADACYKAFIETFKIDANVKIEDEDEENRTTTMRIMKSTYDPDFIVYYKTFKVTTTIIPMEPSNDGPNYAYDIRDQNDVAHYIPVRSRCHVAWTIECEQIDDGINPVSPIVTAFHLRDRMMIPAIIPK